MAQGRVQKDRLRQLCLTVAVLSILLPVGRVFWAAWRVSHTPYPPENLGNWPRILRTLEAHLPDRPLSFAVVGDTRSFGTFKAILQRLKALELDFIVLVGDFVHEPIPWAHRYFLQEMADILQPQDPPVLLVPGNHDVDPSTFPIEAFEGLYGPSTYAFKCAGNLFVMLAGRLPHRKGKTTRLTYLKRILSRYREEVGRVFVLIHTPP